MGATRALLGLVGALAWAQAAAASAPGVAQPWLTLSVVDAGVSTKVELSPIFITNAADSRPETTWINEKTERVWIAEKRVSRAGSSLSVQWADDKTCYQLIEVIATLIDPNAVAGGPHLEKTEPLASGAIYHIDGSGLSQSTDALAQIRLTNGKIVTVEGAVTTALNAWSSCWSDTPSELAARP